tara:strand:- start:1027 stop:1437 length:411 start_codon:yes stop_codon:yes gene_type:complete
MTQQLFLTALLVHDYDEAIQFYLEKLGFEVRLDNVLSPQKRWVVVAPAGSRAGCILLAKAETERQAAYVGNQTGGRGFLFLNTDDFKKDYAAYLERGVRCVEEPRYENYGTVAVFEDLYGNRLDLIQHIEPYGMLE